MLYLHQKDLEANQGAPVPALSVLTSTLGIHFTPVQINSANGEITPGFASD